MGKAARNRARRARERDAGLTRERLDALFALEDVSGLRELLRKDPMLLRSAADRDLRRFAAAEVHGVMLVTSRACFAVPAPTPTVRGASSRKSVPASTNWMMRPRVT
jgi:hypothetical protein